MSEKLPKATHQGEITLGNIRIPCAVLEDGTRVLSEHGVTTAMQSRSGASKRYKKQELERGRAPVPVFMASNNLKPFISSELMIGLIHPVTYQLGKTIAKGYEATLLPQICDVWLTARENGVLNSQQLRKCQRVEMLVRGLAHVGIIALVDEATGYQEIRDRLALQKILEKYITKELQPWAKRFPNEFYKEMFRLKGWQYSPLSVKRPTLVGRYTNDIVYERLAPAVLTELKQKEPKDEKGRRKHKFHQWLTPEVGHSKLAEHLAGVVALMKASANWNGFYRLLQRVFTKYGDTMPLPLDDEEE